jgi:SPOR domain
MRKAVNQLFDFPRSALSARKIKFLMAGGLIILQLSCATQQSSISYSEDLAPNRPVFTNAPTIYTKPDRDTSIKKITPVKNVNQKVDAVLDSIDRINLTKKYVDGFTIQIYSGQKREEAMNVKQKMVNEAGDLASSLQYIQPKFRVTVGSYITPLEAQKDLVRLRHYFSSTILVPEKILLK